MSNPAFFFGSGISYGSMAAGVEQITQDLLTLRWLAHTDSSFYLAPDQNATSDTGEAGRAQDFLRRLQKCTAPHLGTHDGRVPHYEDLFAAATQIVQDEMREITNPMIADTLAFLHRDTADLWMQQSPHIDDNRFASLAARACELIQWAVAHGLARARQPVGMKAISDTAKVVADLDIFTLNHECLIEKQLTTEGIAYHDGFGEVNGDARIFNGDWRLDEPAVRLFKLHGSVDEYRIRFPKWDQHARVTGDINSAKDSAGQRLNTLNIVPRFLTGTTVKEQAYGLGVTGETLAAFRRRTSGHRTIICCGYGFSDKGINQRLNQWLLDQEENRLILLDPREESAIQAPRFWTFRWERYHRSGKLVVVPKWLSQCTVDDLRPYFGPG
ncbi:MAG: SIR2 family protein [Burkholderiales bacterium]